MDGLVLSMGGQELLDSTLVGPMVIHGIEQAQMPCERKTFQVDDSKQESCHAPGGEGREEGHCDGEGGGLDEEEIKPRSRTVTGEMPKKDGACRMEGY